MFSTFLILIWFSPALIAGMLGWSGIWGSGSAIIEYLIPLPVAGGVFHVPGFIVSVFLLKIMDQENLLLKRYISYAAFSVLIMMLALHIDFERFYAWLTTDYQPHGSPIRFDSNTVYLFVSTDAFWIWVYSQLKGISFGRIDLFIITFIPPVVLGLQYVTKNTSGPEFYIGGTSIGEQRGQQARYVFTTADYNEKLLLNWLEDTNSLGSPWLNVNTEHEAVIFTNSLQPIKWHRFDEINHTNTIATVCSYENDKSRTIHKGVYDCFDGKVTTAQQLQQLTNNHPTGFDTVIDYWYARTLLCDGVRIPTDRQRRDVVLYDICINLSEGLDRELIKIEQTYGENSDELTFIVNRAKDLGLPKEIPATELN